MKTRRRAASAGRTLRVLATLFAFGLMAVAGGCARFLHPLPADETWRAIPLDQHAQRAAVHVFIVHGLDPLDYANIDGIRERLQRLGYADTQVFHFYQRAALADALTACKLAHPGEPIALVGFSFGCIAAQQATHQAHDQANVQVDLLFYIGGWFFRDDGVSRPPFVPRVVHVLGVGCDSMGVPLTNAENVKLGSQHFASPTHAAVLRRLEEELDGLAARPVRLGRPRGGAARQLSVRL
jgi:hypothetical protein